MSEHTHKMIELVGSSHASIEAAVQNAIAKAEQDESKLRWFEVVEAAHKQAALAMDASAAVKWRGQGANNPRFPRKSRGWLPTVVQIAVHFPTAASTCASGRSSWWPA